MQIKELITELLNCPMDAEVRMKTSNRDSLDRPHCYDVVTVDKEPIFDTTDNKKYICILFYNWELEEVKADADSD